MRIAYISTTFPKLSEQFLLREVLELQKQGVDLEIYSMFGGDDHPEAGPVVRMGLKDWFLLVLELLYWTWRRPTVVIAMLPRFFPWAYRSWTNYGENALGIAFGFRFARRFQTGDYRNLHATWATAPGMVAYLVKRLTGLDYTIEAHAYDVFRDGGDAYLAEKLLAACAIRSSTETTSTALRKRMQMGHGSKSHKLPIVYCIRRGLSGVPSYREPSPWEPEQCLRVISVGRLIEKKGYFQQLKIYQNWLEQGVEFNVVIVGEGPLLQPLGAAIVQRGLVNNVHLLGKLEYDQIVDLYNESRLFIFTGQVSESGDRDGFPNVIGEAMAHALPVFTTDVSGTTEGVEDGRRGTVIDVSDPKEASEIILNSMRQPEKMVQMTRAAHEWITSEFQVAANACALKEALWKL